MKKKVYDFATGTVVEVDASDPRPALSEVELAAIEARAASSRVSAGATPANSARDLAAEHRQIEQMAEEAGLLNDAEGRQTVRGWIENGYTPDRVGHELYQLQRTRAVSQPGPERLIELTEREAREYRYSRAILMQAGVLPHQGLEWNVHLALQKKFPGSRGILMPARLGREDMANAAVQAGRGAELVQSGPIEFMDMLRNAPVLAKMGARVITVTGVGSLPFVRKTAGAIAQFVATGKKSTRGTVKFQIQEATPKRVVASNDYPVELLLTASVAVDQMWKQDVVDAHSPAWDWAGLYGPGGADPLGVMKMDGVQTVDFLDSVPTSALLRQCPAKVQKRNALTGRLGYLINGDLAAVLAETPRVAGTNDMIWKDVPSGDFEEGRIGNFPARSSNQMGMTGSDYDGLFGPFQLINMVNFGVLQVTTNPFEKDEEGIVKVVSTAFVDTVCTMPEAFTKFDGARLVVGS